jgi:cytochrome c6
LLARLVGPRVGARSVVKDEKESSGHFLLLVLMSACATGAAQAADVTAGAELYRRHCAACHGNDGRPLLPGTPDFSRPAALLKPDPALLASVRGGKGGMPAFQGQLRDREILDIVAHLRTMR